MRNFEDNWKFNIYKNFSLSSEDKRVLSLLYLPIIKKDALILYLNLYDLFHFQDIEYIFNGDDYFKRIGFSTSLLLDAIRHLEGLKLLSTFVKEDIDDNHNISRTYLFKLLPPASSYKFFSDELLRSLLVDEIGEKAYTKLKLMFSYKVDDKFDKFVDISSTFNDVYSYPKTYNDDIKRDDYSSKLYAKEEKITKKDLLKELKKVNFNVDLLDGYIDDVISSINAFGIDLENAIKIIKSSTNSSSSNFYMDEFNKAIIEFNKFKDFKNCELITGNNSDLKYINGINYYNSFSSVEEFLASKMNKKPSNVQNELILEIKTNYKFNNTVIMIIFDYCIKKIKNIDATYITKISDTIRLNKLTDPYDVMEFLNKRNNAIKLSKEKKKNETNSGIKEIKKDTVDIKSVTDKELDDLF